jgi:predicted adenylyl cyclase CyaB
MINDTEIEIKIPIDESKFKELKQRMEKMAKFVKSSQQSDDYFIPCHRNFLEPEFPFEWLSIRRRGDKAILNYKHFYPENAEIQTHCDEFETEIKNPDKMGKIFSALNLTKAVTVDKTRDIYMYNDEFEIALDSVKDLGHFIEIETMKDFGSVEAARNAIFAFAKSLGLDISKTDERGYPYLLLKKKGFI